MTTQNKTQKLAQWCIDNGYKHLATVVKSTFSTKYYNVNELSDVLELGKIPACYHGQLKSGSWGAIGRIGSAIDWKTTITRSQAMWRMKGETNE